jgi:excisionase family DNA binding protein
VTQLVRRFLDTEPTAERDPVVVIGGRDPVVGRHSFRPDPVPDVLTLEQAAEFLQVEPAALAELAGRGEAPGRRMGDEWRFSRATLLAWLGG